MKRSGSVGLLSEKPTAEIVAWLVLMIVDWMASVRHALESLRRHFESKHASNKADTLARIGETLLLIQNVEDSLRFVTNFILQDSTDMLDAYNYQVLTEKEKKRTIGYFIKKIHDRVNVDPDIGDRLAYFLEIRNKFIHHLEEFPGWGLDDETSINTSNNYLTDIIANSWYVLFWMTGLIRSWQIQTGLSTPFDNPQLLKVIDNGLVPFAESSISTKGNRN